MIYLNEIPLTNVSVLKLKEEQEEHRTRHLLCDNHIEHCFHDEF